MSSLAKIVLNSTSIQYVITLFFILSFGQAYSQADAAFETSKKYILGKIKVTGSTTYNEQTIITYTGLRTGQEIYLPGDKISKTIKKLWELGLFKNINFYITKVEDGVADIELNIQQVPVLKEVRIEGVTKSKNQEFIKDNNLNKGVKVTDNLTTTTKNYIRRNYQEKGFLNAKVLVNVTEVKDTTETNEVNMLVRVDKGERVKVNDILVEGNDKFSDAKIKKLLKKTKKKVPFRFWKRSKYIAEDYKEDKKKIIEKYKEKGYRDARIVGDSIIKKDDNTIDLKLTVEEGRRYYFGDISIIGNSVFTDEQIARKLILKKGDVYNGVLLDKRIADNTKPDADDITNLYQNNGYFFSRINPVEVNVKNDTIDFELRIIEGKLTRFDNITVTGNDKTNDHVVHRNLRTRPGEIFSKEKIIRTLRELGQTTFFDTEQLTPNIKNPDPNSGTVDVEYSVVEKGASQFELQGGFGATGFIGTLGLRFNNFSIGNIFNKESYRPLPSGDGQSLAIRAQAAQNSRRYSLSFVEPWLGGKRPYQLSVSFSHIKQFQFNFQTREVDKNQSFLLTGGSIGIAKRLRWPDDYFTLSQAIGFRHYNLNNFGFRSFSFDNGNANDLTYTFGLSRDNTSISPIFPVAGSKFSFTAKASLPYSWFGNTDWKALRDERGQLIASQQQLAQSGAASQVVNNRIAEIDQERFKFLEYYKLKFAGDWYTSLPKKLVLRSAFEFGFLGAYNQDRGVIPFERFQLGGSGLGGNNGLASIENVALRGYPDGRVFSQATVIGNNQTTDALAGSTIFNKYTLELRYPVSLKPAATIYALAFIEGGAAYDNFRQFNPFELNRSAGAGVRIFMPAFGLLGIDFAWGFDSLPGETRPHGQEVHFILGQQF